MNAWKVTDSVLQLYDEDITKIENHIKTKYDGRIIWAFYDDAKYANCEINILWYVNTYGVIALPFKDIFLD